MSPESVTCSMQLFVIPRRGGDNWFGLKEEKVRVQINYFGPASGWYVSGQRLYNIALFPLAAHGGPLWEPLCYAQIGGLCVATMITLLLCAGALRNLRPGLEVGEVGSAKEAMVVRGSRGISSTVFTGRI